MRSSRQGSFEKGFFPKKKKHKKKTWPAEIIISGIVVDGKKKKKNPASNFSHLESLFFFPLPAQMATLCDTPQTAAA